MIDDQLVALSIRQPWAFSIVHGPKRIENRTWSTRFRGHFAIHAARSVTQDEIIGWQDMVWGERIAWPGLAGRSFRAADFDRGGIIGTARLDRVLTARDDIPADQRPWFFGPFGFVLADVRPLPFMPCPGRLGFFRVPGNMPALIQAAGGLGG